MSVPHRKRQLSCSTICGWPAIHAEGWKFRLVGFGFWLAICGALSRPSVSQEIDLYTDDPPSQVGSAQRLMLEQVEQMAAEGDASEAIAGLEKLFDQGAGYLVASGAQQRAGTLVVQRFHSLRTEVSQRLGQLLSSDEVARQAYRRRNDAVAKRLLDDLRIRHDFEQAEIAALRYANSSSGAGLYRLLTDMYLERGWSLAAMSAVQRFVPELRAQLGVASGSIADSKASLPTSKYDQGTLPWPRVWNANRETVAKQLSDFLAEQIRSESDGTKVFTEALNRVSMAMELEFNQVDCNLWFAWLNVVREYLTADGYARIQERMDRATKAQRATQDGWQTFAGNPSRSGRTDDFDSHPKRPVWSQRVPLFMASQDLVPASLPRVGEGERETLPYHPVISGGRLYVNAMTEIQAFELDSGDTWPKSAATEPLFSSGLSSADYLPLGYPLIGTPRATLTVSGEKLFARMGDAVTGRANPRVAADGGSLSQLVGLDLKREGSMLPGFPVRLVPPDFENAEFEGAPVVFGDQLLVTVAVRDNVGLRRSVAAFDLEGGRLRWQSPPLATGVVEGSENANLISHQLLTVAGGRIFYNTNLGSVVCLNPMNGRVLWLTQYRRAPKRTRGIYEPDRFRYRDLNPCLVDQGLVYCAPQDCPEIFALDASTGDLVWSSNEAQTQDLVHLVGTTKESIVASGDRLIWLDRRSGKIQGAYPASNSPVRMNALPQPRGLGRGIVSADRVYWPVSGAILVFSAQCAKPLAGAPVGEPRCLDRIDLGSRGNDGGNLLASGGMLIYSSAMRIMAFRSDSD